MSFRVRRIDHVEVFVPDFREAAAWYDRVLGLKVVPELEHWAEDEGPLMIAPADGDSAGLLALFKGEPRGKREAEGIHRIAFAVSGKEFLEFLERVKEVPVHDTDSGKEIRTLKPHDYEIAFSTYFADPWGTRLEVTTDEAEVVRKGLQK